ncbi:MAG: sigma-70 family RNA polymerase sigma factor [Planctomycetes bacterium]|nr:sigma-70 family RNA polymerase sigma factor [Planctomycetota bacterium]
MDPRPSDLAAETPARDRDLTTFHTAQAVAGEADSLAWIIQRFQPILRAHAEDCLGQRLGRQLDPEDLVQETWAVTLPRLADLVPREGRLTPVLARFLSTVMVRLANRLLQKHLLRRAENVDRPIDAERSAFRRLTEPTRGQLTRLLHSERDAALRTLLEGLETEERQLLLLRAFEQRPTREVAAILGIAPGAVDTRYSRLRARLREQLHGTIFDEL